MLITLEGDLPPGVTAKDFALRVIGDLGADGGLYMSVEFPGSGISALSLESRMVIPNMMAEFGAKNAYLAPDEQAIEYLAERLHPRAGAAAVTGAQRVSPDLKAQVTAGCLYPDPDATYAAHFSYQAGELETYIACPHTMDNVAPLSQVAGTRYPTGVSGHVHQWPAGGPGCGRGRDPRQAGGSWRALYRDPGLKPGAQGQRWSRVISRPLSRRERSSACPAAGRAWATIWVSRPRAR